MLKELNDNYKEFSGNYSSMKKNTETMNKNQSEMKNEMSEIKNILEGIKSKLDEAEDQISNLEDKGENKQTKKPHPIRAMKRKRLKKNKEGLREVLYNTKCNNICIIGIPEGEEREEDIENLFEEIRTKNFPNLVEEKVTQVQEVQRVPIKINSKRPTPTHIIVKIAKFKDKERILKAARDKVSYLHGSSNKTVS